MKPERSWWLLALAALAVRLWCEWCAFPFSVWNAIRLAPTFMLRFGTTPYPGLEGGPVTTWIYGPVTLLLNLPATLAGSTSLALLIAGTINLTLAAAPAALLCALLPAPRPGTTGADRAWAVLLCLALWPNSSLRFIQADNTAVAFGLVSNLLLLRARPDPARPPLLAAVLLAIAVWSKQTSLGLVAAQVIWLGLSAGRAAALRHTLACAAAGLALGGAFVAWFGWDGLWLNLVRLPGRLPFATDPLGRAAELWPHLAGYVLIPAVAGVVFRRTLLTRNSPWLLPFLSWMLLLPTGLLSVLKVGGTANSLNGILYLLPVAALALVPALRGRWRLVAPVLAAGVLAGIALQLSLAASRPLRPVTAHLARADFLAREFPGQIYFPWNPLATFFSDRRFYHAEDGLYVRYAAQLAPSRALARQDFPPRWVVTAYPGESGGWGIIEQLQPRNAQRQRFGEWILDSWPEPVGP